MTVSSAQPFASYIGNAVSKKFAVPFEFFDGEELQVRLYPEYLTDPEDYTVLVLGVDFTVKGGDGDIGEIHTKTPVPANQTLTVRHVPPMGQNQSYQRHGVFPAEAHEIALDKLAMQIRANAYALATGTDMTGTSPAGVRTFNGRDGAVAPMAGDYSGFYATVAHTHTWGDVTGKPVAFPPEAHSHVWADISGKPATFPPSAHTHGWSEVTGKPPTYPAGGGQTGAVQTRRGDGATEGNDLVRASSVATPAGMAGAVSIYSFDQAGGAYSLQATITYNAMLNGLLVETPVDRDLALKTRHLRFFSDDLVVGQALFLGEDGLVYTAPGGGSVNNLNDVGDVEIVNPAEGEVLTYVAADGSWRNLPAGTGGTAGVSSFNGRTGGVVPIAADYQTFYKAASYVPGWTEISNKPATFAPSAHTHPWAEVTGKPATFPPETHTHFWADISGKPTTFAPSAHQHPWSDITGAPSTYAPSAHVHAVSDVSGLQALLDSKLTLSQVTGKQTIFVPAASMSPTSANGAAPGKIVSSVNKVEAATLDFDSSTEEYAQFHIQMPKSWDLSSLIAEFVWSHGSATVNFGVVWRIQALAFGDDAALDIAWPTAVAANDTGGTANDVYRSPETAGFAPGNGPSAQCLVIFRVYREVASASDTLAVDAKLIGVKLHYTTTAAKDD